MKAIKRLCSLVLAVIMATALFASCKPQKHTHNYVPVVTAPTCTEEGFTTHTCSCGKTFVDSKVPAVGHTFVSEVKRFPTTTEKGLRVNTCSACDESESREIDVVPVIIPEISDLLVQAFGPVKLKWSANGNMQNVNYDVVYEDRSMVVGYKNGYEFAIEEAEINTLSGEFVGFFKFSCKEGSAIFDETTNPDDLTVAKTETKIYVYVNGNQVSWSIEDEGAGYSTFSKMDANALIYSLLADMRMPGMPVINPGVMLEMEVIINTIPSIVKVFESLTLTEIISKEYVNKVDGLVSLFLEEGYIAKEEGENTVLELNFNAVSVFLNEMDGKLLKDYLNEVYGEGSFDNICEFIENMPAMTIREISNTIIALSESCNIDVNRIHDIIDVLILSRFGVNQSIVSIIQSAHDLTLHEAVVELGLVPESFTVEDMKAVFLSLTDSLDIITVDELLALYLGTSESVIETIEGVVGIIPQYVTFELVYNSSDEFEAVRINGQTTVAGALAEIKMIVDQFVANPIIDAVFDELQNIYGYTELKYFLGKTRHIELDSVIEMFASITANAIPDYDQLIYGVEELLTDLFAGTVGAPQVDANVRINQLIDSLQEIVSCLMPSPFVDVTFEEIMRLMDGAILSEGVEAIARIAIDEVIESIVNVIEVFAYDNELLLDVESTLKEVFNGTIANPMYNEGYQDVSNDLVDLETTVDDTHGLTAFKATLRDYTTETVGEFVYNEATQQEEWVVTGEVEHLTVINLEYARNVEDGSEVIKFVVTYDGKEQANGCVCIKDNKIVYTLKEGNYTEQVKIEDKGNTTVCTVYGVRDGVVMSDATYTFTQTGAKVDYSYEIRKEVVGTLYYGDEIYYSYYSGSGNAQMEIVVG
ncbi:MAG: hypothetical protein IJA15_03215 [Clostridia bacterium]|nr:hypothetical protein [Clostridia bacterium]